MGLRRIGRRPVTSAVRDRPLTRRRRGPQPRVVARRSVGYVTLIVLAATIILPLGWMITTALKPDSAPVFTPTPQWFPTDPVALGEFRACPARSESAFLALHAQHAGDRRAQHDRDRHLVFSRGLCVCSAAIPRPRVPLRAPDHHDVDPVAGPAHPAVPSFLQSRLVRHHTPARRSRHSSGTRSSSF